MKRILIVLAVVVLALAMVVPAAFAQKTIGVVIPYEIGYFAAYHTGFQSVADAMGVKLVFAYHGYNADKEAEAVQNLISQGVDAINVVCVSPESAQYSCVLANEAGIPIQCSDSGVGERGCTINRVNDLRYPKEGERRWMRYGTSCWTSC